MTYHKFSNVGQILQEDLTGKLMEGISSKDFEFRECNCHNASKTNWVYIYNGDGRRSVVVYKTEWKKMDKFYIGNTQQKLKQRMSQHFSEIKNMVNADKLSDSFAKHFASLFFSTGGGGGTKRQNFKQGCKGEGKDEHPLVW